MDKQITINFRDIVGESFDIETLKQLRRFVKSERSFWQKKQEKHTGPQGQLATFLNVVTYLEQIEITIEGWGDNLKTWDEETLQQQLDQHIQPKISQLVQRWVWHGHPFIEPWFSIVEKYETASADAFIESFINKGQIGALNTKDRLQGTILAYEFDLQDESTLTSRRNAEKKSISKVRADLISAKDDLFKDVAAFQDGFHEWDEETRKDVERLYRLNKTLGERQARKHSKYFNGQLATWNQNIADLEHTYKEKLRLEQPATYWRTKAEDYSRQGKNWIWALGLVLVLGMAGFGYLFWEWLQMQETLIKLNSLQGVALLIVIISSYAFMIKAFSRLAFSSFHLQRDAEEREQLTHVYLALNHEKGDMDAEAKNIVLQALFSRADTGLLSGESSPTMPGLHELVKATSSK